MSMRIGIRAWIDFAFRKIFGKPGNEICLISLLNAVLQLPRPVVSVEYLNPFGMKDFETDKLVCVDGICGKMMSFITSFDWLTVRAEGY